MASIRDLDSFMGSYSVPSFLKEEPTSFSKALKEWQDIQGNYYKNDKARMEIEDKEEQREKNKEREKKMLELGLALDADDLQGSLRKVIDFSKGEGDINSAMSGIGRLYQLKEYDKNKADADLRKAMGITKKQQKELEKKAQDEKTVGFLRAGTANGGSLYDGLSSAFNLATQNGDLTSAREIAKLWKSLPSPKNSSGDDDEVDRMMNNAKQNNNTNTGATYEGQRATGLKVGSVVRYDDGKTYQVGKDGNLHLLK